MSFLAVQYRYNAQEWARNQPPSEPTKPYLTASPPSTSSRNTHEKRACHEPGLIILSLPAPGPVVQEPLPGHAVTCIQKFCQSFNPGGIAAQKGAHSAVWPTTALPASYQWDQSLGNYTGIEACELLALGVDGESRQTSPTTVAASSKGIPKSNKLKRRLDSPTTAEGRRTRQCPRIGTTAAQNEQVGSIFHGVQADVDDLSVMECEASGSKSTPSLPLPQPACSRAKLVMQKSNSANTNIVPKRDNPQTAHDRSSFLTLPVEVRMLIFRYVCSNDIIVREYYPPFPNGRGRKVLQPSPAFQAISAVSRLIRDEVVSSCVSEIYLQVNGYRKSEKKTKLQEMTNTIVKAPDNFRSVSMFQLIPKLTLDLRKIPDRDVTQTFLALNDLGLRAKHVVIRMGTEQPAAFLSSRAMPLPLLMEALRPCATSMEKVCFEYQEGLDFRAVPDTPSRRYPMPSNALILLQAGLRLSLQASAEQCDNPFQDVWQSPGGEAGLTFPKAVKKRWSKSSAPEWQTTAQWMCEYTPNEDEFCIRY